MASADQQDTVVLRHDTLVLPRPPAPETQRPPAPGAPPASAWSQIPPFPTPAAPPVLVMRNNAAVVGATLGSVALFVSLIPLIGIIAWVLAPIGLLSSGIGLLVGVSRRVGRVAAFWGLVASGGALLVCLAWAALILGL